MIAEPVAEAWTPLCFEADELAGWHLFNDRAKGSGHVTRPCADCLPAFAAEMRAVARCNGTPRGGQEVDEMVDPLIESTVESRTVRAGLVAERIARRVSLEVTAPPCGSCAHEPICSLRAALEGMAIVETSAPPLPAGLRLSLTASVECSHFLRDKAKPAPVRALTIQERGQANGAGAERAKRVVSEETRARMRQAQLDLSARRAGREGAAAE